MQKISLALTILALSIVLTACGGGSSGGSSSPTSTLSMGLIHEWKFDGDVKDSVGTLNGTVIGTPSYSTAVLGKGIALDGTTMGVDAPLGSDTQFQNSFTISAWVKLNALPPDSRLWASVLFDGDDRPGLDPFALLIGPGGDVQFQLMGSVTYVGLTGTMPVGQFVLLTGTYDKASGDMRFYMNGQLTQEHSGDTTLTPVVATDLTQHARIGIGIGNANGFPDGLYNWGLDGILDDVRMYNRALSATEVQKLYALR